VTIRTFDVGEDRQPAARGGGHRDRFGVRGIRSAVLHDDRFRTQIRALLRASPSGTLRILLPFVTNADELQQAREVISATAREVGVDDRVPLGAMIEVPAAALTVDQLARHVDFLSVGTNDLIQYTLAVDRTDERLSGHYEPAAPAVLRLLRTAVVAARRAQTPISVCGEMASDPIMVALLVGMGFRSFSMAAAAVPMIKQKLHAVDSREAAAIRARALREDSADGVRALLAPLAEAMRLAGDAVAIETRSRYRNRSTDVDVTRVEKPWGYELHWAKTDRYVGKLIHVNRGHALSLQYHNQKDETIYLWSGKLLFEIEENGTLTKREMMPGEAVHVTPKTVHRMTAIEDADIFEVSTPELHDVVRLEDRYGREDKK
jgi:quercetin dioxygenase-like cupin family protein